MRGLIGNALIPPSQVGPFPYNWLNEAPGIVHRLPRTTREALNETSLRATAILWLRPRLTDVPVHQRRTIKAAARIGDQVALTLDDGTHRFDHVLMATGYRIDVDKMPLLDPRLRARIARRDGLPVLSNGLEFERARPAFRRRRRGRQLRAVAALHRRRRLCRPQRHPRGAARRRARRTSPPSPVSRFPPSACKP